MDAWLTERKRRSLLRAAGDQAKTDADRARQRHEQPEKTLRGTAADPGKKATRLAQIAGQSTRSQLLGIYDDRIETEQQLADVYAHWAAQVMLQHKLTGRLMLQSIAIMPSF